MQLPNEVLEKWQKLRDGGDNERLSDLTGLSDQTISNIFNGANLKESTFIIIRDFYNKRESEVEKAL